ncbi:uncharacterized protein LOC130664796 [Microplitis mediator]|uniref:uncharacterized protein LOC130664796 n=1 Tax=Microplitis mediator TaxID=375433 RepID=UPI002553D283|nr:uncharacterized protein LOC130664796 [Microplitis mediator]
MEYPKVNAGRRRGFANRFSRLRSTWGSPSPPRVSSYSLKTGIPVSRSSGRGTGARMSPNRSPSVSGAHTSLVVVIPRSLGPRGRPLCPRCDTDDIHYNTGECEANLVARVVRRVEADVRGSGIGLNLEEVHALFSDVRSYDLVELLRLPLLFLQAASGKTNQRLLLLDPLKQAVSLTVKETAEWFDHIPTMELQQVPLQSSLLKLVLDMDHRDFLDWLDRNKTPISIAFRLDARRNEYRRLGLGPDVQP